jgi:hypothetical protein
VKQKPQIQINRSSFCINKYNEKSESFVGMAYS